MSRGKKNFFGNFSVSANCRWGRRDDHSPPLSTTVRRPDKNLTFPLFVGHNGPIVKKIILLIVLVGGGFYFVFTMFSRSPEEAPDGYGEEEYIEYVPTVGKKAKAPPDEKETAARKPPPPASPVTPEKTDPPQAPPPQGDEEPEDKERGKAMVQAIKNFSPKDLREVQQYYQELEDRWKSVVKNMIGEKDYADYERMRQEFQRERQTSFREFHESMMAEHGDSHVYSPLEYEKQVGEKIQQAYFERFRERFGPEVHQRYRKTLQRFNGEAKRNQDPAKGLLKMFF